MYTHTKAHLHINTQFPLSPSLYTDKGRSRQYTKLMYPHVNDPNMSIQQSTHSNKCLATHTYTHTCIILSKAVNNMYVNVHLFRKRIQKVLYIHLV